MTRTTLLFCLTATVVGCQSLRTGPAAQPPAGLLTYQQITEPVALENDEHANALTRDVFELDIDMDGRKETFVSHPQTGGNSGVNHSVYRKIDGFYKPIGDIFFHPLAFTVLEPTEQYPIRVVRYLRSSATEGYLDTIGYQDGAFIEISTELIHPGDGGTEQGNERYAEVFGE